VTSNNRTPLPTISVVVPVYNSEGSLPDLIKRLELVLHSISSSFEVVLINDGSHDQSWDVICQLARARDWLYGINLMRNYGQHNAVLCGIRSAKNEIIVTIDDDLQHPPEEIPKLLDKLAEGFDVVYGKPHKVQHGVWRGLASQITKFALQSAMGARTARDISAFRVFHTKTRDAFANYQSPHVSIDVLLTWGSTNFSSVPVRHNPRQIGVSNYTFLKLVTHAFDMITGFSTLPLRLASISGFFFTLVGIGILAYVLGHYFYGGSIPGFPFLASIIAIFAGAQLFVLGIFGEYLARMYQKTINRPVYTMKSTTDTKDCVNESSSGDDEQI